jgi:hypothetical protein
MTTQQAGAVTAVGLFGPQAGVLQWGEMLGCGVLGRSR